MVSTEDKPDTNLIKLATEFFLRIGHLTNRNDFWCNQASFGVVASIFNPEIILVLLKRYELSNCHKKGNMTCLSGNIQFG